MNETVLYLFVFGLIWAVFSFHDHISDFFIKTKFERQREKEFQQNVTVDATGEPQVLRSLDEFEKQILINEHKQEYQLVKFNHYFVPLFAVSLFVIFYLAYRFWGVFSNFRAYLEVFTRVTGLMAVIFSGYMYKYIRENNLDKDLRAPVFVLKGELLKWEMKQKDKTINYFTVRGVDFSDKENPQVDIYWKDWAEGTVLKVEYSPFTKHIWKIDKAT